MMISSPTKDEGGAFFHSNGLAPASRPSAATGQATIDPGATYGTKRLASCREELERSWCGARPDLRCVSHDGSGSEDCCEADGRAKRRRTLQWNDANDETMTDRSFVRGTRISSSNRPPRASARPQVKAGWYEGEVDAGGNRHGRGITKHDDGTEYEGPYSDDLMCGEGGRYKFIVEKHLVPNPRHNGSHLSRQIEKTFEGSFRADVPHGVGTFVTKTVDTAPQAVTSAPPDVRSTEVVYDVGVHNSHENGRAVGEGVRIIYSTEYAGGLCSPRMDCYRLYNGENTSVRLGPSYATWVFQSMGVEFPKPSM